MHSDDSYGDGDLDSTMVFNQEFSSDSLSGSNDSGLCSLLLMAKRISAANSDQKLAKRHNHADSLKDLMYSFRKGMQEASEETYEIEGN